MDFSIGQIFININMSLLHNRWYMYYPCLKMVFTIICFNHIHFFQSLRNSHKCVGEVGFLQVKVIKANDLPTDLNGNM